MLTVVGDNDTERRADVTPACEPIFEQVVADHGAAIGRVAAAFEADRAHHDLEICELPVKLSLNRTIHDSYILRSLK